MENQTRAHAATGDETSVKPSTPASAPGQLITRREAARRLGLSTAEVKRRERLGRLPLAGRDANGWSLYHPSDVAAQPRKGQSPNANHTARGSSMLSGDELAAIFTMLREGRSLVDIVIACKVPAEAVRGAAKEYAQLDGSLFVSGADLVRLNAAGERGKLSGVWPVESVEELLSALEDAAQDAACPKCGERARALCKPCGVAYAAKRARDGVPD